MMIGKEECRASMEDALFEATTPMQVVGGSGTRGKLGAGLPSATKDLTLYSHIKLRCARFSGSAALTTVGYK